MMLIRSYHIIMSLGRHILQEILLANVTRILDNLSKLTASNHKLINNVMCLLSKYC